MHRGECAVESLDASPALLLLALVDPDAWRLPGNHSTMPFRCHESWNHVCHSAELECKWNELARANASSRYQALEMSRWADDRTVRQGYLLLSILPSAYFLTHHRVVHRIASTVIAPITPTRMNHTKSDSLPSASTNTHTQHLWALVQVSTKVCWQRWKWTNHVKVGQWPFMQYARHTLYIPIPDVLEDV